MLDQRGRRKEYVDANRNIQQLQRKHFVNEKTIGVVIQSDRGAPYTSRLYYNILSKVGAQINISRRGNCYGNASIDSFFSHLKTEGLYPYCIRSWSEAQKRMKKYIHFYNTKRPQRKLKQTDAGSIPTPVRFLGLF